MIAHFLDLFSLLVLIRTLYGQQDWSCDHDFTRIYDSCFKLVSVPATYEEAITICKTKYGGNLASLHHDRENEPLGFLGNSFLIGLRYYEKSNSLKWSDQSPVNYTRYNEAEFAKESINHGDCTMWNSGKWKMISCKEKTAKFLCKKPLSTNPDNYCPGHHHVYNDTGTIYSPGWPREYHIFNKICIYNLVGNLNSKIQATLKVDSLGVVDGCHDAVEVYEGLSLSLIPGARLLGTKTKKSEELHIETNKIFLQFAFFYCPENTKRTRTFGKWKIHWTTIQNQPTLSEQTRSGAMKLEKESSKITENAVIRNRKSFIKHKSVTKTAAPVSMPSYFSTGICYQGPNALATCGLWCNQKGKEFGSCILTGNQYKCWCFERVFNSALRVAVCESFWWETPQHYYWYSMNNNRISLYSSPNYGYNYWNYNQR